MRFAQDITSNKHSRVALLAILSSRSIAAAEEKAGGDRVVARSATVSYNDIELPESNASTRGSECVMPHDIKDNNAPFSRQWRKRRNIEKPDLGILSSSKKEVSSCQRSKGEACEADSTSSLGGRCVVSSFSRRMMYDDDDDDKRLRACNDKCPGNTFCDCAYSTDGCSNWYTTVAMASACEKEEHWKCLGKNRATLFDVMFCPANKCIVSSILQEDESNVDEDGFNESKIYSAYTNTSLYMNYMNCMNCVGYKGICEFCKENDGSSPLCVNGESNILGNVSIDDVCYYSQMASIVYDEEGSLTFNETCADFVESQLPPAVEEHSPSSGHAVATSSVSTLALVSMSLFKQ